VKKKHEKELFVLTTIQFKIDYDKKTGVAHDAAKCELSLSTIMRRMVEIYLTDYDFRRRVLQYNPYSG
jgi:hypothetical protein